MAKQTGVPKETEGIAEEVVIPVIAEEITVQTHQVARAKVHVHKRVETREEVVDAPIVHEEVVTDRIPINRLLEDKMPETSHEDDVLVIPVIALSRRRRWISPWPCLRSSGPMVTRMSSYHYYFIAMILRGGSGGVIPGEPSETRNPGGITTGKCFILLDASFRWHDEIELIRINAMDHYFVETLEGN